MRLSKIIDVAREAVAPWVQTRGGRITVAKDPWHAYELVSAGASGLIVVLGYGGERLVDAPRGHPLAVARIEVTVANGMGLTADTGEAQFKTAGDRASLADLLDDLIQTVAAVTLAADGTTSRLFEYQGDEPLELPSGVRLAAYRITFHLTRTVLITPTPVS